MSLGIVDSFTGDFKHGEWVKDAAQENYNGAITDYGLEELTMEAINQEMGEAVEKEDVVNMSISAGDLSSPLYGYLLDSEFAHEMEDAWGDDTLVTLSAGNDYQEEEDSINGLAVTPFSLSIGAMDGGEIASYSQGTPFLTGFWASGNIGEYQGTSFSAPRVAGAMAEVKENLGLSNPEAITLYEQTSDPFLSERGWIQVLDAQEMVSSDGVEEIQEDEIVDGAYRTLLGRQPDGGSSYWDEGDIDILAQVAQDSEDWNQDLVPISQRVKGLYNTFLEREADTEGMGYWMREALTGSWQELTESFINSAEVNGEEIHHQQALNMFLDSSNEEIG